MRGAYPLSPPRRVDPLLYISIQEEKNSVERVLFYLAYGNLANIFIQQNKLQEAEEAYRTALKFRYNMADTHYNL